MPAAAGSVGGLVAKRGQGRRGRYPLVPHKAMSARRSGGAVGCRRGCSPGYVAVDRAGLFSWLRWAGAVGHEVARRGERGDPMRGLARVRPGCEGVCVIVSAW